MDQDFEQIELVYTGGDPKFGLHTVPPTDRSPSITPGENADYTTENLGAAIDSWTTRLKEKASVVAAAHPDIGIKVVDPQWAFNGSLDSGAEAANCWNGDGANCLWFNDYHPGLIIQNAVAQAVAAALGSFIVSLLGLNLARRLV